MAQGFRFPMTEAALHRIGKLWVRILKQRITETGKIASGFLKNSISYSVEIDGNGDPILVVNYADYFKYVNEGRLPRGEDRPITAENGAVPIPALLKWISIKGIRGNRRRGQTNLSLAFAIRASIWKKGIKPYGRKSLIYDKSLDRLEKMLDPTKIPQGTPPELIRELTSIFEAVQQDVNVIVDNMIDNLIKTK